VYTNNPSIHRTFPVLFSVPPHATTPAAVSAIAPIRHSDVMWSGQYCSILHALSGDLRSMYVAAAVLYRLDDNQISPLRWWMKVDTQVLQFTILPPSPNCLHRVHGLRRGLDFLLSLLFILVLLSWPRFWSRGVVYAGRPYVKHSVSYRLTCTCLWSK